MSTPSGSEQEGVLTYAQILDKFCLEKETTIMTALKACPPVRNVRLNRDNAGAYRKVKVERPSNFEALLIQATGELREQPCERCINGRGPFAECVTTTKAGSGACANCHHNSQGASCRYHHYHSGAVKKNGKRAAPPQDKPTGPATNKRGRIGNEAVLAAQAVVDSAGGPGPATLAYRTAHGLRATMPTASGVSGNSFASHGGFHSPETSDSFDSSDSSDSSDSDFEDTNNTNRVSYHDSRLRPLRIQIDQPRAPQDASETEDSDDDMEVADPRPGRQVLKVRAPVAAMNPSMRRAGIRAPPLANNMNPPAVVARTSMVNLAGAPAAADPQVPFARGTPMSLSYDENRFMARQFRALAEEYDARAEGMLARQV